MPVQELIKKTAEDIGMSTRKLDPFNPAVSNRTRCSLSTEAGRGRIDDRLAIYLRVLSRLSLIIRFLDVTCCLHGHILAFKYSVEKFFMLGVVEKRTLLQLLHAVCAIENEFELQDLRVVWLESNGEIYPGKTVQSVLTR